MEDENKVLAEISAKVTKTPNDHIDTEVEATGSAKDIMFLISAITSSLISSGIDSKMIHAAVVTGGVRHKDFQSAKTIEED